MRFHVLRSQLVTVLRINWNQQATKLFGWHGDEAVNKLALRDVFTEESCEAIESPQAEKADSYEVMAVRKNNIQFPAEIRSYNMTLSERTVRMLFIRDITIQRLIEERYRLAKNGR